MSDLHLGFPQNRDALPTIPSCPEDWLILAGDVGESRDQLQYAIDVLSSRFKQLVWVPGNHELWTLPGEDAQLRGEAKYRNLVELCRASGVVTPEDPYPVLEVSSEKVRLVPMFLLYDYTFRPAHVPSAFAAVEWAAQTGVVCTDEHLLHPDPYPDAVAWCEARCRATETRLKNCRDGLATVLVNHWPLREDLARLPLIPRFSIWCGTKRTTDWHKRFNAKVVVSGHLHIRSTTVRDGTRFEEVSLGYPRQWRGLKTIAGCVRQILPAS